MFSHTLPVHLTFHALANCVWEPLIKRALAYSLGEIITSTHPTAKHDEVWVGFFSGTHTGLLHFIMCHYNARRIVYKMEKQRRLIHYVVKYVKGRPPAHY